MTDFLSLGLSGPIVKALKAQGIAQATPIQEKAIPIVLEGRDVIGQAQTGTGKTFAFILPILENIDPGSSGIQALIVAPTRELALQITEELRRIGPATGVSGILAVYGGQDIERQLKKLSGNIQIVVATPGRILDHIRRETIDLTHVSILVLDEADQMLHIGFLDEVEQIISHTPASRQTLLFSATMPDEVRRLARSYMKDPLWLQAEKVQSPAITVKQIAVETTDRGKKSALTQLIDEHRPYLAVVFCRTKRRVSKLAGDLQEAGYLCGELHGDLSQPKRERVMERFRTADIQVLVATDVAARGLDIEGITHVFNYDIPLDADSFVHRIGRTGRAGTKGIAITIYTAKERELLEAMERKLGISIKKAGGPSEGSNKRVETKKQSAARKPSKPSGEKKRTGEPGRRKDSANSPRKNAVKGQKKPPARGAGARTSTRGKSVKQQNRGKRR